MATQVVRRSADASDTAKSKPELGSLLKSKDRLTEFSTLPIWCHDPLKAKLGHIKTTGTSLTPTSVSPQTSKQESVTMDKPRAPSPRALIFPFAITFVLGLALFLTAGTFTYWQGWVYLAIFFCLTLFMVLYLSNRSPELLERRADLNEAKPSTKSPAVLNVFLLIYIVPGFDFRFGLSSVPAKVVIVADFFVLLGYLLIILVFRENSFASSVVKLEDGQTLISTGPYQVVRHPMYAGMLVMTLFTPLALGSYWAYIPCAFFIPWLLLRIKTEEETLLSGLVGYQAYCDQTRYRLIPGVW